jgi:hypothetical protein
MFIQIYTPGVKLAVIPEQRGWIVNHHRLFDISPNDASSVPVIGGKVSIWALCFTENLFQATNDSMELIIDIGWYPEADPEGSYKLKIISFDKNNTDNPRFYNWRNPVFNFDTKSLSELLGTISSLMKANSSDTTQK